MFCLPCYEVHTNKTKQEEKKKHASGDFFFKVAWRKEKQIESHKNFLLREKYTDVSFPLKIKFDNWAILFICILLEGKYMYHSALR